MTVSLNEFQEAIEEAGGEWYGEYKGRSGFDGYGGKFEHEGQLVVLGATLEACGLGDLIGKRPHIDSLGHRFIVVWPKRCFHD